MKKWLQKLLAFDGAPHDKLERLLRSFSSKCDVVSLTDVNRCSHWCYGGSMHIGSAPIHIAARNNDLAGMRLLLDNGADVNLGSGGGSYETALHEAAREGNYEMLQLLLERGADVNAMGQDYETPLHRATDRRCILALVAAGAWADGGAADDARTPLHNAVGWYIWPEHAGLLGSPEQDGHAARSLERVKALLEAGANVNAIANSYDTPLHHFLGHVKPEFLEVAQKANGAFFKLFMSVLSLLLQHGAEVNARDAGDSDTPLHIVVKKGLDLGIMNQLLQAGACVNANNSYSRTPLHEAVEGGYHEHAERLLQAGAAVGMVDVNGKTVADIAKNKGNDKMLSLLSNYPDSDHRPAKGD